MKLNDKVTYKGKSYTVVGPVDPTMNALHPGPGLKLQAHDGSVVPDSSGHAPSPRILHLLADDETVEYATEDELATDKPGLSRAPRKRGDT